MPVLSDRDWAFWEENGYVVIPDAVPQENLDALVEQIWTFLEMEENDRESWYKYKPYTREELCSPISQAGMVEMYQHQTLWDNRQYPRLHQAFSELLGTERLWVSLDRANMKPPDRPDRPEWGHKGMIHWDIDTGELPLLAGDDIAATWLPNPDTHIGLQGVLYLTDTDIDQASEVMKAVADELWQENHPELTILEEPSVWGVQELGNDAVVIRLVAKTDPSEQWAVARALRARIKKAFDEVGIEIPFPQRTVWIRNDADEPAPPSRSD